MELIPATFDNMITITNVVTNYVTVSATDIQALAEGLESIGKGLISISGVMLFTAILWAIARK